MIDEIDSWPNQTSEHCAARILECHQVACSEIESMVTAYQLNAQFGQLDELLAAIVLLAWFEVIHDHHDGQTVGFPQHAANSIVIIQDYSWNMYSRHLLSWLKTLDTKATHMGGGDHLLSAEALKVVSTYPTQIITSNEKAADDNDGDLELAILGSPTVSSNPPAGECTSAVCGPQTTTEAPSIPTGHAKQILLHTIFQPCLEWYSAMQLCSQEISSQDKHHRTRFTAEDEYEVILICKELEGQLWRLWEQRPKVMSLPLD
ncbi:hypothetical protein BJY01DRAFT_254427 [Aspergillus pseudoustus]|uniref:Uncharacterized protein n=1 Tax=Aspergillus pseudoustus TaxID=1810923 RepID=A0ABR4ITC0_9EURO